MRHPDTGAGSVATAPPAVSTAYCIVTPYRKAGDGFWQVTIPDCPHCGQTHYHGGGPLTGPAELGHRVAHCLPPVADEARAGYTLVPITLRTG